MFVRKLKQYYRAYQVARRLVRNWYKLLLFAALRRPSVFELRGGARLSMNGRTLLKILVRVVHTSDKIVHIDDKEIGVKYFGHVIKVPISMLSNPNIVLSDEESLEKGYDFDVRDEVILDIGAYIGDTPLYWIYKGAAKVVAVEPVPEHYQLLLENCKGLPVVPILGSVGSKVPNIPDLVGSQGYGIKKAQDANEFLDVPVLDLLDLVNTYKPSVVKINCEGCEYFLVDQLLKLPTYNVRKLALQIHRFGERGYQDLLKTLEKAFGKGRITKVIGDRAITVVWEFDRSSG
ncbi:MAG: FkbM family methyltransferase [Nitrososphaerota archaeon]|nr:FkbM family methyltransferase [Nitrososphaerota archaeon]